MNSGIFRLDWGSIADAAVMAIVSAVVVALVSVATTSGFNVFSANWAMIGEDMVNLGFIAGVVSLGQNFISTNTSSVLGITRRTPRPHRAKTSHKSLKKAPRTRSSGAFRIFP